MPDRRFSVDAMQFRFRLMAGLVLLVFGTLFGRLIDLQVVHGDAYREKAEDNRIRDEVLRAHRGQLLDRYGRVLADNAPSFHLILDPQHRSLRKDRDRLVRVVEEIAPLIGRSAQEILETVDETRRTGRPPLTLARALDFRTRSLLEERMETLPGVEVRA
ncbi:MAG: hypothetical protein GF346_12880, partial [Candidatus Eisenbacteria bacterium]|nr:hypothetical protein [Candidatus Latescibacterota bacterium]MBD3303332.1 hypothetical protein [Candidatus Eisenbacteria bacterium]